MTSSARSHLGERQVLLIQAHVDALDRVAVEMESKWGVGRLPLLVDPDLAARFKAQRELVNKAVWESRNSDEVKDACAAMARAWAYLDQQATAAGQQPLQPEFWEVATADGLVIVIARNDPSAWEASRQNRQAIVYTVEEVGRLLAANATATAVKEAFPHARVTNVRVKAPNPSLDDPIPF